MAEAVIVATSRTAIGRAGKGSFVDARPDDMSAFIIDDVLGKVPELPHDQVEDVIWGTAQPGGEQGYNLGRVAGLLAGLDAPGTTVNRYCSSSLQTSTCRVYMSDTVILSAPQRQSEPAVVGSTVNVSPVSRATGSVK